MARTPHGLAAVPEELSEPAFKSPVALHVEALTQSMRTLDRLKSQQAPLTPQRTPPRTVTNESQSTVDGARSPITVLYGCIKSTP